jgi:hypothetical protein
MTKKTILTACLIVLLGGLSLYLNRDRFTSEPIQISVRSVRYVPRPNQRKAPGNTRPMIFLFNREVRLTSLKVVPLSDLATNESALPVWELISDSNSVPVKDFRYGARIAGMRPPIKGVTVQPLEPGAHYRVLIRAGSKKAQHDFEAEPVLP